MQVVFTADGFVTLFALKKHDSQTVDLHRLDTYDIRGLCVHPACIISVTMTNLKSDNATRTSQGNIAAQQTETLVLNVSGRVLMVNKENNGNTTEHLVSEIFFLLVYFLLDAGTHGKRVCHLSYPYAVKRPIKGVISCVLCVLCVRQFIFTFCTEQQQQQQQYIDRPHMFGQNLYPTRLSKSRPVYGKKL